jgi:dienelactone hydrolase
MTSYTPKECCVKGTKHGGQPTGTHKQIGGYDNYTSYPEDQKTSRAILILTDVLGHNFINVQLLADAFAENGYFVVVPDLFHGSYLRLCLMQKLMEQEIRSR